MFHTSFLGNLGLPLDFVFLALLAVALFVLGTAGGRRFSFSFILSLYLSQAVVSVLPAFYVFLSRFNIKPPVNFPSISFVAVLLFSLWVFAGSSIFGIFHFSGRGIRTWWQVLAASVLGSAMFGVFFLGGLPRGSFTPSSLVKQWIFDDPMPVIWALAPLVLFLILRASED